MQSTYACTRVPILHLRNQIFHHHQSPIGGVAALCSSLSSAFLLFPSATLAKMSPNGNGTNGNGNSNGHAPAPTFRSYEEDRDTKSTEAIYATSNGAPVPHPYTVQRAGLDGPLLLQDFHLIDLLSHFDRERYVLSSLLAIGGINGKKGMLMV